MDSIMTIFELILDFLAMVGSAVNVLLVILPFVIIIVTGYIVYCYFDELHCRRIAGSRILELDNLPPGKLRHLMLYLLGTLGYEAIVEEEPAENENEKAEQNKMLGAVILVKKDETRFAVLAESRTHGVGQGVFTRLENAMDRYNCEKGIIINNGNFDSFDRDAAGYGDIELWDRERIIRELLALQGIEDPKGRGITFHLGNFFRWVWNGG